MKRIITPRNPLPRKPAQQTPVVQIVPSPEIDPRRPCYVRGKKALFHRWVNSAHPVLPRGEEPSENARYYQFRRTEALVEYEDGTIARVFPSSMQFADGGGFDQYEWLPREQIDQEAAYGDN